MGYPKRSSSDSITSLVVPAYGDTMAAGRWPTCITLKLMIVSHSKSRIFNSTFLLIVTTAIYRTYIKCLIRYFFQH